MDRRQLEAWIAVGRSLEWIGRQVGKHPSTVSYWLRKFGLVASMRDKHRGRGGLPRDALEALVAQDLTVRQIAARVDRSPATVRHWLAFYGLQTTRAARRRRDRGELAAEAVCAMHGAVRHTVLADGRLRCARCNSEAVTRRRREVKRLLAEEAGGACAICAYDRFLGALQFHHVNPAEKRFNLGLKGLARALDQVREEARKCVLLCANCHAEVEGGVISVPPEALHHIRG
jgi:DNA-binding CsgD family transcriptional regulator